MCRILCSFWGASCQSLSSCQAALAEQNGWGNLPRIMVGLSDARQHLECDWCMAADQWLGCCVEFWRSIAAATRLTDWGEGPWWNAIDLHLFTLDYYLLARKDVHRRCPWRRLQTLPIGPAGCPEDGGGTGGDAGCWSFEPMGLLDWKVSREHLRAFGLACAEDFWKGLWIYMIWSKCKAKCKAFPTECHLCSSLIPRCAFLLGTELMALRICSAEVTSQLLHNCRFSWFLILVLRAPEFAASTSGGRKDYRRATPHLWPCGLLHRWGRMWWRLPNLRLRSFQQLQRRLMAPACSSLALGKKVFRRWNCCPRPPNSALCTAPGRIDSAWLICCVFRLVQSRLSRNWRLWQSLRFLPCLIAWL